jgi:hypothetical protein
MLQDRVHQRAKGLFSVGWKQQLVYVWLGYTNLAFSISMLSLLHANVILVAWQHTAVLSLALCWRISSKCIGSLMQSQCGQQLLCLDLSFCDLDDFVVRI